MVDTNVLIDVATKDPDWFPWSSEQMRVALERGPLVISPIIYAELSPAYATIEELDNATAELLHEEIPWEAAFLAGHAFKDYRARGGQSRTPLADFYIGAHALVRGYALVTRDPRRYRTAFPRLAIISPG